MRTYFYVQEVLTHFIKKLLYGMGQGVLGMQQHNNIYLITEDNIKDKTLSFFLDVYILFLISQYYGFQAQFFALFILFPDNLFPIFILCSSTHYSSFIDHKVSKFNYSHMCRTQQACRSSPPPPLLKKKKKILRTYGAISVI